MIVISVVNRYCLFRRGDERTGGGGGMGFVHRKYIVKVSSGRLVFKVTEFCRDKVELLLTVFVPDYVYVCKSNFFFFVFVFVLMFLTIKPFRGRLSSSTGIMVSSAHCPLNLKRNTFDRCLRFQVFVIQRFPSLTQIFSPL